MRAAESNVPDEECPREIRSFVDLHVRPLAASIDFDQKVPRSLLEKLSAHGYLGAAIPREYGGRQLGPIEYGQLHEEFGNASASVDGMLNVHNMAAQTLLRWGSRKLKREWLPHLGSGSRFAAFALSEAGTGSDANSIATTAEKRGSDFILRGTKKWITAGQVADVFLILVRCGGVPTMFLVDGSLPGISRKPIKNILGCRGYMLAEIFLDEVAVPLDNMIGGPGFGLSHVATTGLDAGRYALSWGCVGMARACLEDSLRYASAREQFGVPILEHQLVQRLIARMVVGVRAARALCMEAGRIRQQKDPSAADATAIAKYFVSTTLPQIAADAVQVHGAAGCSTEYAVARYFRDSKIMEIIEGTTQIHEMILARYVAQATNLQ